MINLIILACCAYVLLISRQMPESLMDNITAPVHFLRFPKWISCWLWGLTQSRILVTSNEDELAHTQVVRKPDS